MAVLLMVLSYTFLSGNAICASAFCRAPDGEAGAGVAGLIQSNITRFSEKPKGFFRVLGIFFAFSGNSA